MQTYKNKFKRIGLAAGIAAIAAGTRLASADSGLYLNTDAGINLMGNLTGGGATISTDPGVRWSFAGGYRFGLAERFSLDVEAESGVLYNSLHNISVAGFGSTSLSGDYYQIPMLANLRLNYHAGKWIPYIGGGAGAVYSSMTINSVGGNPLGSISGETDVAYQAMAGVRYKLGEHAELGLGYKLLSETPEGLRAVLNHSVGITFTLKF